MKIKSEHYKILETEMKEYIKQNPKLKGEYKKIGRSKERYVWDIFNAAGLFSFASNHLYDYLYDSHIQTALLKIVSEY